MSYKKKEVEDIKYRGYRGFTILLKIHPYDYDFTASVVFPKDKKRAALLKEFYEEDFFSESAQEAIREAENLIDEIYTDLNLDGEDL